MKTVYVGLSGGVDSSVAAALLKEQGYRVVGVYMKNWTADVAGVECPWKKDLADARAVAAHLDIPFKIFDFQKEYKAKVVDYMVAEYKAGRTPNPDVMCNQEIKFKLFLGAALADGADLIATGHYARIRAVESRKSNVEGHESMTSREYGLFKGVDESKDQSYFLCRVTKEALEKTLMPIGEYAKAEIRQIATKLELPTASKPDSQGICFVGEVGIKDFLKQYIDVNPGEVKHKHGKAYLGKHDGAVFYTIGQRHGLGIGGGTPYYITGKDMKTNTIWVTEDPTELSTNGSKFSISSPHWINEEPQENKVYEVAIRYHGRLTAARVKGTGSGVYEVELEEPERSITAGQSAVFYDGERVVGGGIIEFTPAL